MDARTICDLGLNYQYLVFKFQKAYNYLDISLYECFGSLHGNFMSIL